MSTQQKSPYLDLAQVAMPRLLSRMDREQPSRTYGGFDRTYWAWKFTDFAGARFQEGLYALAWMYSNDFERNPYYAHPKVMAWLVAGLRYWQRMQHGDGSFDEAYPYERSLAATAFTSFYIGEALLELGRRLPATLRKSIVHTFQAAGDWLCINDEYHGVLSNHLAAAAAALVVISEITGRPSYQERAQHFLSRIVNRQSTEGWYEEYGGADIGYQTHATFYLANIWRRTGDERLLASLERSVEFLAYFVHPNGTIGGEYASRNTTFYFPAGFEILAPQMPKARAIAIHLRGALAKQVNVGLTMMDAYNFCPMLNNYLFAHSAAKAPIVGYDALPFEGCGHWNFPDAGLLVHSTKSYYAIFAPSKGGVLKVFDKRSNKLAYSDCGYWAELRGGSCVSSQSFSKENAATADANSASVRTPFTRINQTLMSPWLFLAFRCFTQTVGRQKMVARKLKGLLALVLVRRRRTIDLVLERYLRFEADSVTISDHIDGNEKHALKYLWRDPKFSSIHMGSARYFQPDELDADQQAEDGKFTRSFTWTAR